MQKWEYFLAILEPGESRQETQLSIFQTHGENRVIKGGEASLMVALKILSDEGWELVSYDPLLGGKYHFLAKRPLIGEKNH